MHWIPHTLQPQQFRLIIFTTGVAYQFLVLAVSHFMQRWYLWSATLAGDRLIIMVYTRKERHHAERKNCIVTLTLYTWYLSLGCLTNGSPIIRPWLANNSQATSDNILFSTSGRDRTTHSQTMGHETKWPRNADWSPKALRYQQIQSGVCMSSTARLCFIGRDRLTKFKQIRQQLGLLRTRQQGLSVNDIIAPMTEIRQYFPTAGSRECISILFHDYALSVSR